MTRNWKRVKIAKKCFFFVERSLETYSKKIYDDDDAVSVGVGAIVANYADLSHLTSQLDFQSLRN